MPIASAAEDTYCTAQLKQVVRRDVLVHHRLAPHVLIDHPEFTFVRRHDP